mmetsp:Transcript_28423/g.73154  ORF Transcript_28423/g.73154 Transcript_28423/m.73154 type:complete len:210 (-) Transcript_28423:783-1412(-)
MACCTFSMLRLSASVRKGCWECPLSLPAAPFPRSAFFLVCLEPRDRGRLSSSLLESESESELEEPLSSSELEEPELESSLLLEELLLLLLSSLLLSLSLSLLLLSLLLLSLSLLLSSLLLRQLLLLLLLFLLSCFCCAISASTSGFRLSPEDASGRREAPSAGLSGWIGFRPSCLAKTWFPWINGSASVTSRAAGAGFLAYHGFSPAIW